MAFLNQAFHEFSMTGGFYFSHSDIAGKFGGVLFGITNSLAQIPGEPCPKFIVKMCECNQDCILPFQRFRNSDDGGRTCAKREQRD